MARGFMYVYKRILKETRGENTDKSQERDERKR